MMRMKERVRITDVSPRDGLQNEPGVIATGDKVKLVQLLCRAGVDEIELTSFVSPKWVPQLADGAEVCVELARSGVRGGAGAPACFSALVPNPKGLQSLESTNTRTVEAERGAGVEVPQPLINKIALFTAASETFSRRNTNASISESLERFGEVLGAARGAFQVRGYISCAIACPFEGPIRPEAVADLAARLADMGIGEVDLGDTIGAATAESTARLLDAVARRLGEGWFERRAVTLHLHDTFGRAAECVKVALDNGIRSFDGSVAGLGGCPYASTPTKRAPGNIGTETLVRVVQGAGYETGVDEGRLLEAGTLAREIVSRARSAGGAA